MFVASTWAPNCMFQLRILRVRDWTNLFFKKWEYSQGSFENGKSTPFWKISYKKQSDAIITHCKLPVVSCVLDKIQNCVRFVCVILLLAMSFFKPSLQLAQPNQMLVDAKNTHLLVFFDKHKPHIWVVLHWTNTSHSWINYWCGQITRSIISFKFKS